MKLITAVSLAAGVSAFVIPDAQVFEQIALEEPRHDESSSWWDVAPSKDDIVSSIKDAATTVKDTLSQGLDDVLDNQGLDDILAYDLGLEGHGHHGHHHKPNKTIYQLISSCKYTSKFAHAVSNYSDIVNLLNSTEKGNFTLFVPLNSAFEHDSHDGQPSKEFIEAAIKYHIVPDAFPAARLLHQHTVPTLLKEPFLGGRPQRLRVGLGLDGVRLNFFSRVVAANIGATNGVVHAVAQALMPPPMVGRELALFPSTFSTLLYAYDKTDFVKFIHNIGTTTGTTMFAPTNLAWAKLGPRTNAFLFNTEQGLICLKGLLKYQISINETLYSDAYYRHKAGKDGDEAVEGTGYYQVDLPSLLRDKPLRVDVVTKGPLIFLTVNGHSHVLVQDGVAKNGVIHVVDSVPIPSLKHHGQGKQAAYDGGEIEVEDLIERLGDYIGGEDGGDFFGEL